jgi:hypothetical protein
MVPRLNITSELNPKARRSPEWDDVFGPLVAPVALA